MRSPLDVDIQPIWKPRKHSARRPCAVCYRPRPQPHWLLCNCIPELEQVISTNIHLCQTCAQNLGISA